MTEEAVQPAADSLLVGTTSPSLDFASGKPDNFPDDFWNPEANQPDVNRLFQSYESEKKRAEGLRVKLSKGEFEGKAPEDIKEYTLELKEEVKGLIPDDDRLIMRAREVAKEAGLPKEAFAKFMQPMIEEVIAMQQEATKEATPEEIAAAKEEEIAKLGAGGRTMVAAVKGFIETMAAEGKLSDSESAAAQSMVFNADTLKVMNKLRSMIQPSGVPVNLPVSSDSSKSDIEAKMVKAAMDKNEAEYNKYAAMLTKL
jgi:hypothetical protein